MKGVRDLTFSFASAVLVVVLWFPISFVCESIIGRSLPDTNKWLFTLRPYLQPESAERVAYLTLLATVTLVGMTIFLCSSRRGMSTTARNWMTAPAWQLALKRSWVFIILAGLAVAIHVFLFPERFFFLRACEHHFGIIQYPFVMQEMGTTQVNQYGAYFLFLRPWCQLFGTSIFSLLVMFSLLQILSFSCIMLTVSAWCPQRRWMRATFFAAFLLVWPSNNYIQVYVQYHPIRTILPMLMLLLWAICINRTSDKTERILRKTIAAVAGLAPIWNFDTGIVVVASALAFLFITSAFRHRLRHFAVEIIIVILAFCLAYSFAAYSFHDINWFGNQISFQQRFYMDGYFMLPMQNIFGSGAATILTIAFFSFLFGCCLLGRFWHLPESNSFQKGAYYVSASIMSLGLFAYYQGRSHPTVLLGISWSALFLFVLLLQDGLEILTQHNDRENGKQREERRSLSVCLIALSLALCVFIYQAIPCQMSGLQRYRKEKESPFPIESEVRNLGAAARKIGLSDVLVISDKWQPIILRNCGLRPKSEQKCLTEVFLVEQERSLLDALLTMKSHECAIFSIATRDKWIKQHPELGNFLSDCHQVCESHLVMYSIRSK